MAWKMPRAIAGAKDIPALLAINAELTEAGVESALGCSRGVYGIESEAQAAFSALAEEAFGSVCAGGCSVGGPGGQERSRPV